MEKNLQRIANTLVLYSYHVNNPGLLAGKMGIILYLYRYSKFAGNEFYSEFAGDMLDTVLRESATVSTDFENGLTGIGWAVNYLLKRKIIDGDVNDVLRDVDTRVFGRIECNPENSVLGHSIYLLERLRDNKDNVDFEKRIQHVLHICRRGLSDYKGRFSLYHLNSLLYFLIEVDKASQYADEVEKIRSLIPQILGDINHQNCFDSSDIGIFDQLFAAIETERQPKWQDILRNRPHRSFHTTGSMEQLIRKAWMEELYFGRIDANGPTYEHTKNFIDQAQESITLDNFLFMNGLAGLGCTLLSQLE